MFNVRKGVTFHSGKTLDADDIIYSLNLHRGETKSAAKDLLSAITDIKKLSATQIAITLSSGNADLPYNLSDYHILVVPNGFTDFSKPDGTGAYALETFEPGVRVWSPRTRATTGSRTAAGSTAIELKLHPRRNAARTQALISGQVDAVNRLDPKTVGFVHEAARRSTVVQTKGSGNRFAFVALCDTDPFKTNDARMALKYGIDRKKIVDTVYKGYASIGNDTTHRAVEQVFRAERSSATRLRSRQGGVPLEEGRQSRPIELQVSEGAFSGATDARRAVPGVDEEGRHRPQREARVGRRLLGQRLAQGAVLRRLLGWPADRRPAAVADLHLDGELERHALARPRVRQDHGGGPGRARSKPSASRCTPRRST